MQSPIQYLSTLADPRHPSYIRHKLIDIIALHDIEPKFLQDVTNAKLYKLIIKGNK